MRQLSATTIAGLSAGTIIPVLFAKLDFAEQSFGFTTFDADVTVGGQNYTGVSTLGSISTISGVSDLSVAGATLTLNGIDPAILNDIENFTWHLRPVTCFLGLLDPLTRNLVDTPFTFFSGIMTKATVKGGAGKTGTIEIQCESMAVFLTLVRGDVRSDADQRTRNATDTFFVPVANAGQEELFWGALKPREHPNKASQSGFVLPSR